MIIPNTVNGKLVDDDGNITPEWELFFSQLINVLQIKLYYLTTNQCKGHSLNLKKKVFNKLRTDLTNRVLKKYTTNEEFEQFIDELVLAI